jgi:hypothetical protein
MGGCGSTELVYLLQHLKMINIISEEPSLSSPFGTSMMALPGLLTWFWKLIRDITKKYSKKGIYEVLDFQTQLTIHDSKGKSATLTKYEKVRFLQDNIIAYQDQAWGDGRILQKYRCSSGLPVDIYRIGQKTYVLISLRAVKTKGDVMEFNIQWKMKDGFLKPTGFWGTDINHSTNHIKIQVVFPKSRPPQKVAMVETNWQKEKSLEKGISFLPDRRCQITWEKDNPKLYEHYVLKWIW